LFIVKGKLDAANKKVFAFKKLCYNISNIMVKHKKYMLNIANLYRKALDVVYDGVYFVDKNKKILFWSEGAERILGYLK
jgi:PAS domain-containing protein